MDIIYHALPENTNWIILVYIFILVVLIAVKSMFTQQFKQQLQVATKNILASNLKLDHTLVVNFYTAIFVIIKSLCLAFIIYLSIKYFTKKIIANDFYLYLKISFIILLFFVTKYLLSLLFATIFKQSTLIHKIVYIKIAHLNFLSLFILAWLPFVVFNHTSRYILFTVGCAISSLLILYFYYLLLKTNLKIILKHFFYFILYLCALELAPIIILYRAFISKV